jgi:GDP-4-dehydro-6-deoxy-D-mannose reductase
VRALVTGAGGFVGVHLVRHLEEQGDEVLQLERTVDGIDIADADALTDAVVAAKPEVVYHLAGAADVGGSWAAARETFVANALGTLNVLEASREAGADRVLAVTSADVYGRVTQDELPIREDQPLRPVSPYAASKVAADALAQQAWLGHRLPVVRVRAFNHLGPGQSDRFLAPSLAARIARNERDGGEEVPIGNQTPRRDVTDVRDVVRAYRLLIEASRAGSTTCAAARPCRSARSPRRCWAWPGGPCGWCSTRRCSARSTSRSWWATTARCAPPPVGSRPSPSSGRSPTSWKTGGRALAADNLARLREET